MPASLHRDSDALPVLKEHVYKDINLQFGDVYTHSRWMVSKLVIRCYICNFFKKHRMHSSRMRTTRPLTIGVVLVRWVVPVAM